jgi:chaperonin GroEL
MPPKTRLLFDDEVREKVVASVDILERAVGSTLGPRSRAVGIDQGFQWRINKDGVSVAKAIFLEDPFEDFGVKVVREAAQKTVDEVGDGTTVTVILAHALIHECLKVINSGVNPMSLRKGLEEGVELLTQELDKLAIPVKTLEQKKQIATISASGDEELGDLIATTLDKIGVDGVITVEESRDMETKVEMQEGMQLATPILYSSTILNV